MSATALAESDAESRLRVTFCEETVELVLPDGDEPEPVDQAPLADCFGHDGTAICAVCLGRCSRDATLCAGDSAAAAVATIAAAAAAAPAAMEGDAAAGPLAGTPDLEQGTLLAAESQCQDAALTQTALRLQCNHVFHVDCLSLWMKRATHPTCPTCRAAVAPAQLTHTQASSPEIRELIERTVTPPVRSVRWSLPSLPRRAAGARSEGPAATSLGSRWQCKQVVANLAFHLCYPMALFGGIGGILYVWSES
jgi:hypothetical protein